MSFADWLGRGECQPLVLCQQHMPIMQVDNFPENL